MHKEVLPPTIILLGENIKVTTGNLHYFYQYVILLQADLQGRMATECIYLQCPNNTHASLFNSNIIKGNFISHKVNSTFTCMDFSEILFLQGK